MKIKEIRNELLGEMYYDIDHPSGLKILLMPKAGYASTYAIFATKYGSIDTMIETKDGSFREIPKARRISLSISSLKVRILTLLKDLQKRAHPQTHTRALTERVTFSPAPEISKKTLKSCLISFRTPISPRRRLKKSRASSARK